MDKPHDGFFSRWPNLAIFGTFLGIAALSLAAASAVLAVLGESWAIYFWSAVIGVWVAALAWGIVLSNVGAEATRGRSFPLCFALWVLRPPQPGTIDSVERLEPRDLRMGVFYLAAIAFIAVLRLLVHVANRVPETGDIVTLRAPWPHKGFLVAEIKCLYPSRVLVKPLRKYDSRPRTFRIERANSMLERFDMDLTEYEELNPKLMWRGDREFWMKPAEDSGTRTWPRLFTRSSGRYEFIALGGENVEKLAADPHAFDNPPLARR